jgi:ABC-type multidrug transport system fused ATPase/permease subunit
LPIAYQPFSADQILVLDNGEITEQGTHQELMTLENGKYKI